MSDYNQEKADALIEALKRIVRKIERGYPIAEQQEKLIIILAEDILQKDSIPDYNQRVADTQIEALTRIAHKIECGYPITEGQEKLIVKLARGILFDSQTRKTQYEFKRFKPQRLVNEDEEEQDSGREPGE